MATETKTWEMHKGEVRRINLQSRGSSGLQLLYRCEKDSIVEISRVETQPSDINKAGSDYQGSPISAIFEIKALEAGETKVTFYETRPWDKDFKEILVKEIMVTVK